MTETGHGRANPGDSGLGQRSGIAGPSQAKSRICERYFVSFSDASRMEEIADSSTSPAEL